MWDLEALFFQGSKGGILFFPLSPTFPTLNVAVRGGSTVHLSLLGGIKLFQGFLFGIIASSQSTLYIATYPHR